MPERLPRPPIRLAGELPDGKANGTAAWADHFLNGTDVRWAIVAVKRKELTHDDESGADVAKLRIVLIQPAPGEVEGKDLARLAREWTDAASGQAVLNFGQPAGGLAKRQAYETAIADYCAKKQLDPRTAWEAHFGDDAPVGPRGAELPHLIEFAGDAGLLISEEGLDAEAEHAAEQDYSGEIDEDDDSDPEGDARHALAMARTGPAPAPDWSDGDG